MVCPSCRSVKQAEFTAEMHSPFPRAQEYRQAWCLVIPRTTGLFGLRLLSVYRFGG